jgi:hypothetical protein
MPQTWAAAFNVPDFLDKNSVLDKQHIGETNDIISLKPNTKDLSTSIKRVLATGVNRALVSSGVLVLMVFAPVTPDHDISLDFQDEKSYLTTEHLREMIEHVTSDEPLQVILMTPSAFTGGWCCRPAFLNGPPSDADKIMCLLAKSCGGALADSFINLFLECDNPLMTKEQREKIVYRDPMPLHPTGLQTDTRNQLHRQVHQSLEHRLSPLAGEHGIILGPDGLNPPSTFRDAWTDYGTRTRALSRWVEALRALRLDTEPSGFDFLGKAFGGTMETQLFHLAYLVNIEMSTSVEDWNKLANKSTLDLYRSFLAEEQPSEEKAKRVYDMIEHRASTMALAHMIAKAFGLAFPAGVKARFWKDVSNEDPDARMRSTLFGEMINIFEDVAVVPGQTRHDYKDAKFVRPSRWLAAAIAPYLRGCRPAEAQDFVEKRVKPFIEKIRKTQKQLLTEDRLVIQSHNAWVSALGLDKDEKRPTSAPPIIRPAGRVPSVVITPAPSTPGNNEPESNRRVSKKLNAQAPSWPITPSPSPSPASAVGLDQTQKPKAGPAWDDNFAPPRDTPMPEEIETSGSQGRDNNESEVSGSRQPTSGQNRRPQLANLPACHAAIVKHLQGRPARAGTKWYTPLESRMHDENESAPGDSTQVPEQASGPTFSPRSAHLSSSLLQAIFEYMAVADRQARDSDDEVRKLGQGLKIVLEALSGKEASDEYLTPELYGSFTVTQAPWTSTDGGANDGGLDQATQATNEHGELIIKKENQHPNQSIHPEAGPDYLAAQFATPSALKRQKVWGGGGQPGANSSNFSALPGVMTLPLRTPRIPPNFPGGPARGFELDNTPNNSPTPRRVVSVVKPTTAPEPREVAKGKEAKQEEEW